MSENIRVLVGEQGRLPVDVASLSDDLHAARLTSHARVTLMPALEGSFDIEFPDDMLHRRTFASTAAIRDGLTHLDATEPASQPASCG